MIKISKLADYAVVVLAALATSDTRQMTASGLSSQTGLPEPTVAKVLKLLTRDNILESLRGVNGGYRLTMAPADLSIARVVVAVDGPVMVTSCVEGSGDTCSYQTHCAVKGRWNRVNDAVRSALEGITLRDMMQSAPSAESVDTRERLHDRYIEGVAV